MLRLWLVEYMEAHPVECYFGKLTVIQKSKKPTEAEAEMTIHRHGTLGAIWIDSIQETSEKELRYKDYRLLYGEKI